MTSTLGHMNGVDKRLQAMHQCDDLRATNWRLELKGGEWVQFRDPETVTESQRRTFKEAGLLVQVYAQRMEAAMASGNLDAMDMLAARQAAATLRSDYVGMALVIESWSFSVLVPTLHEPDTLSQLDGPIFDRLNRVCESLVTAAFFDASPSSEERSPFVGLSG